MEPDEIIKVEVRLILEPTLHKQGLTCRVLAIGYPGHKPFNPIGLWYNRYQAAGLGKRSAAVLIFL
jgi:hypothetical protein